jgi:sporulation protein YlmC with PRC-barrel domain
MLVSKKAPKFIPVERFVGMQVIDNKGAMVGNVKDISVDFQNRDLAFRVDTKAGTELDFALDDVISVQDVVLLKKDVDMAMAAGPHTPSTPTSAPSVQTLVVCSNCGASSPGHAKFCPKCGTSLT